MSTEYEHLRNAVRDLHERMIVMGMAVSETEKWLAHVLKESEQGVSEMSDRICNECEYGENDYASSKIRKETDWSCACPKFALSEREPVTDHKRVHRRPRCLDINDGDCTGFRRKGKKGGTKIGDVYWYSEKAMVAALKTCDHYETALKHIADPQVEFCVGGQAVVACKALEKPERKGELRDPGSVAVNARTWNRVVAERDRSEALCARYETALEDMRHIEHTVGLTVAQALCIATKALEKPDEQA